LIRLSHNDKFSIMADVSDVRVSGSSFRARAWGSHVAFDVRLTGIVTCP
jgi:hypothetical protein